jgi:NADH-quinone oxidoreductase subunit E
LQRLKQFQAIGPYAPTDEGGGFSSNLNSNFLDMLSEATRKQITDLMKEYPQPRSALIPALRLAQTEAGYLSESTLSEIAEVFGLSPGEVLEVASFYSMLYTKPVGKYVIQVCNNISCMLQKSDQIIEHLQKRLGIKIGETTPDRRFTLLEAECLASCGTGPAAQINDNHHENLTPEKMDQILDGLE